LIVYSHELALSEQSKGKDTVGVSTFEAQVAYNGLPTRFLHLFAPFIADDFNK